MAASRRGRLIPALATIALLGLASNAMALDFERSSTVAVGSFGDAIGLADFDRDGSTDVAVVASGGVAILRGDGHAGIAPMLGSPFAVSDSADHLAVGDFNGDHLSDVVTTAYWEPRVTVLLGDGDGGLGTGAYVPIGETPPTIGVADLDADGDDDLLLPQLTDGTLAVLLSDGAGSFGAAPGSPVPTGKRPLGVTVGDFDGDGVPDAATANADDGTVTVLLGAGDGTFDEAPGSPVGGVGIWPRSLVADDLDRDGDDDLAVIDIRLYRLHTLLGDGDGRFGASPWPSFETGWRPFSAPAVGNLDGDARPDLAIGNWDSADADLLRGAGDGVFAPAAGSRLPLGGWTPVVALHDFDGDGLDDIAAVNGQDLSISIFRNTSAPPALETPPAVTGRAASGERLTCAPGVWSGSTATAQTVRWLRDGEPIEHADDRQLTVTKADRTHALACEEHVVNELGTATSISEPVTVPAAPIVDGPPAPPAVRDPPVVAELLPRTSPSAPARPAAPAARRPVVTVQRRSLRATRGGLLSVTVRCVAEGGRCDGAVSLRRGGDTFARSRFSAGVRGRATVTLRLTRAVRRQLANAPGRRIRVLLVVDAWSSPRAEAPQSRSPGRSISSTRPVSISSTGPVARRLTK